MVYAVIELAAEASLAGQLDRAQCAIFSGWEVGGLFHKRVWELGSVCGAVSKYKRQMASVPGRRRRTTMAARRERIILLVLGRENDGCGGEDRWQFRGSFTCHAISD